MPTRVSSATGLASTPSSAKSGLSRSRYSSRHVVPSGHTTRSSPRASTAAMLRWSSSRSRVRRDQLRHRAQAVRHRGHRLPQRRGHDDGVQQRAVVAHVQAPAAAAAAAALARGGHVAGREAVVHAGERAHGEADAVREEGEGDGAEDGERDAEWEEGVHGERGRRRGREGEAAVVEDEGPQVPVPRQRAPSPRVGLAHSESFLHAQIKVCTLYCT